MPGSTGLRYTDSKTKWNDGGITDTDSIVVNIGDVNDDAARWWSAVLAPEEGWEADITSGQNKFKSPWSISLQANKTIVLSRRNSQPPSLNAPVSFEAALRFLSDYCTLHNIVDQSNAALSTALFIPSTGTSKGAVLPQPKLNHELNTKSTMLKPSTQRTQPWIQEVHHIDKLLTLSCNRWGFDPC